MLDAVDRPADRGRRPQLRCDHDQILRRRGSARELGEHAGEPLARVEPPLLVRRDVPRPAVAVLGLLQAELADVARDRRLSHPASRRSERVPELELRADALARDDTPDQPQALALPDVPVELHNA